MNHKYKKMVLGAGWAILSIAIIFIISEGFLRCFAPLDNICPVVFFEYDAEALCRLKKNLNIFRTTDYQQEIHTNGLGTVNFQENFNGYKHLIFALGDSYTRGTGLPADAAYPFQLDLMLNFNNGKYSNEYGIVNLGQEGVGTKQAIAILGEYSKRLRSPEFILYVGCPNDFKDDLIFSKIGPVFPFLGKPGVPRIIAWLANNT